MRGEFDAELAPRDDGHGIIGADLRQDGRIILVRRDDRRAFRQAAADIRLQRLELRALLFRTGIQGLQNDRLIAPHERIIHIIESGRQGLYNNNILLHMLR